jgi:hypothetical protein
MGMTKERSFEWNWDGLALQNVDPIRFTDRKNRWRNYQIIAWLEDNIEEAMQSGEHEYRRSINEKWAISPTAYDDYSANIVFSDDVSEETIMMFVLRFG